MVVIRYEGSAICGGGLLTSKAVLTSSQCCERIKSVSKTKVIAGALTLSDSTDEEAEVRDVIKIGKEHPLRYIYKKTASEAAEAAHFFLLSFQNQPKQFLLLDPQRGFCT